MLIHISALYISSCAFCTNFSTIKFCTKCPNNPNSQMREIIVFSKLEVKRSHQEPSTLDRSWGYDSPSFFFFFAIEGHVVTPNRLFSRVNRGFCFPLPTHYRDGMRCLSFALARHGPRHGFSSSYPCWAAYYGRVPPISTRAIALLHHRCMCAPRLIAQVTGNDLRGSFIVLSGHSFSLRAISF